MGMLGKFFLVIIILTGCSIYKNLYHIPPIPELEETWWGKGHPDNEDKSIKPFKINVPDKDLEDLKERLINRRPFVSPLEGIQQQYGMNTNLLNNIVEFWKTKYNWKEQEKFLNKFSQFKTSVQGLNLHFLHVKPEKTAGLKVLPLLLLHGWPGSVREFYEIIPILTTPQPGHDFVFEVIAPSLPGYGFSDSAVRPGLGAAQMSVVFKNLMQRLGFEKYYIQGGDWGAIIVQAMAILFPNNVLAVHSNMCIVNTPTATLKVILGSLYPSLIVDKDHENLVYPVSSKYARLILETGYLHLQATKPDTIGIALNDSPVGLAAYILEKFTTWTNPEWPNLRDGGLTKKFSYTKLLDNIMIYWVSNSITTSMRLYSETFNKAHFGLELEKIPVQIPSACARFRHELAYTPDIILKEKYNNLVHVADYDAGHFPALEVPEILAKDIYISIDKVRKIKSESEKKEL